MATTQRSDGLNNPLSPNSGFGCTWENVEKRCEESDAVASHDDTADGRVIVWLDGNRENFTDPQAALIAIRRMSE